MFGKKSSTGLAALIMFVLATQLTAESPDSATPGPIAQSGFRELMKERAESNPASQSSTDPNAATAPAPLGPLITFEAIKQFNAVMEKSRPTDKELIMCSAIKDRSPQIEDTIFYALLAKADAMPEIQAKYLTCLNRLSTPAVMLEPEKYRMAPTRLSVLVFVVQMLTPGKEITRSWAGPNQPDQPVWLLLAENAESDYPAMEGMRIYTTKNPMPILGTPDESDDFAHIYKFKKPGARIELAALFYKLSREADRADRVVRDFPVFIAWQFTDPSEIGRAKVEASSGTFGILLFVLVVGLGIAFFVFLKSVRHSKDSEPMVMLLKKKREQEAKQRMEAGSHEPVDPALQAALDDFEKNRNAGNENNSGKSG